VDAAGNVFYTDYDRDLVEVPAGGGPNSIVPIGGAPDFVAVDGAGDVFITKNDQSDTLVELKGSQPPTLNFGKIAVGGTSSPQSVTIQNVGNQPLNAVSPGLSIGTNFLQVPGSGTPADCTNSFLLAPGTSCNLSIVFAPQALGTIKGTATFTDNALNTIPFASQNAKLRGVGVPWRISPLGINYGRSTGRS
jgi:Abnormal spindle-like microcephaly-assoc'd, ASPM-SPD-2-Hydin